MEDIDITLSKEYFDKLVEADILKKGLFSVLQVTDRDVQASPAYINIKIKIYEEYQVMEKEVQAHKKTIKELYKKLEEIEHE